MPLDSEKSCNVGARINLWSIIIMITYEMSFGLIRNVEGVYSLQNHKTTRRLSYDLS